MSIDVCVSLYVYIIYAYSHHLLFYVLKHALLRMRSELSHSMPSRCSAVRAATSSASRRSRRISAWPLSHLLLFISYTIPSYIKANTFLNMHDHSICHMSY